MALPTPNDLQALLADLTRAVQGYSTSPDLNGYMSRINIIEKAKQITQSLIPAEQLPYYHGLHMAEAVAIRTFIKLKVLEAIPETGSISLQELSEATGAQDSLLERMGRILVAGGFLNQTREDGGDYMHTKYSLGYITSRPGPEHVQLDDYLVARNQLTSAHEPDDPLNNPYTWSHKQDGTPVWAIMAQDPEKIQTFQVGMSGLDVAIPVTGHFDFNLLKSTPADVEKGITELVDVGGGVGVCLKQITEAYPALDKTKCVLQERKDVIEMSEANNEIPKDFVKMEHDFRTEQPIKGAKAYFFRMIMHDYADPVCVDILSHIARAMSPDSRVLVCDMVLPQRANEATFGAVVMDQAVMTMGGKERTEAGFKLLFEGAGIELVQVWRAPGVPGACVEGRLKR
ncbi:O-methyltransferase [Lachnellula subtilissima]|uniref:O-methyltransferase n=1 Tax=Lachnellula subtilissima TaxID=602034 RepID=A0A8H8RL49_9HELO|nr:O-methyltransferase [Lachnellula subtilissima]